MPLLWMYENVSKKTIKKSKEKTWWKSVEMLSISSLYGLANQGRNLRKWDQSLYTNYKINKAAVREMNC